MQRCRSADPLESPFFQRAEDLGLKRQRQLADLVEKQRAAMRELEFPGLAIGRAGERAFLVAKELGLEQVLRNRGTVDGDKRPFRTRAEHVQRPRKQFLARPAFAFEQHRRIGRRRAVERERDLLEFRILADDLGRTTARRQLLLQQHVFHREPPQRERTLHHQEQMIGIDRLGEKVERTLLHRRHGILDAAVRGHHDDGKLGIEFLGGAKHAESVALRKAEVGQDDAGTAGSKRLDRLRLIARLDDEMALRFERKTQHRAQRVFVLDEEDWGIGRVTGHGLLASLRLRRARDLTNVAAPRRGIVCPLRGETSEGSANT